jgi:hypothetical protein
MNSQAEINAEVGLLREFNRHRQARELLAQALVKPLRIATGPAVRAVDGG